MEVPRHTLTNNALHKFCYPITNDFLFPPAGRAPLTLERSRSMKSTKKEEIGAINTWVGDKTWKFIEGEKHKRKMRPGVNKFMTSKKFK